MAAVYLSRLLLRVATITLVFVCATFASFAQSATNCSIDLPVVVMLRDGRNVDGVPADGLVVSENKIELHVKRIVPDKGARRVLLVVDDGSGITDIDRKIETTTLTNILEHARPQDEFALRTARGPRVELPFGTDRATLLSAIAKLNDKERGHSADAVLTEVEDGLKWFGDSKDGDAVFTVGAYLNEQFAPALGEVENELQRRNVRMFTLFLRTQPLHFTWFGPLADQWPGGGWVGPDPNNIVTLTFASGGYLYDEDTGDETRYKLTDERLRWLEQVTWRMYSAIDSIYAVQIDVPRGVIGKKLTVELASAVKAKIPSAFTLFPWQIRSCEH